MIFNSSFSFSLFQVAYSIGNMCIGAELGLYLWKVKDSHSLSPVNLVEPLSLKSLSQSNDNTIIEHYFSEETTPSDSGSSCNALACMGMDGWHVSGIY